MAFIPIYTHANIYNTDYAQWLPGSDEEVIERVLLANFFNQDFKIEKLNGIIWIQPRQTEYNTHIIVDKFGLDWKLKYEPKYTIKQEQEKIQVVYKNLQQAGWDIGLLKKYRLDYIIWDKKTNPEWSLNEYKELNKVHEEGEVEIYVFN